MKFKRLTKFLFLSSMLFSVSCCAPEIVSVVKDVAKSFNINTKTGKENTKNIKITFELRKGELISGNTEIEVPESSKFGDIKDRAPKTRRDKQENPGWYYISGSSSVPVTDDTVFLSNTILYANWSFYKITFNAGVGGRFSNGATEKYFNKSAGIFTVIHTEDIDSPHCSGKMFAGWSDGNEIIKFPYYPTKDTYLQATYTNTVDITVAAYAGEGYYKDNGNKVYYLNHVTSGTQWSEISKLLENHLPSYDGEKIFKEWTRNGNSIHLSETFTSSIFITATYCDALKITFDAQNGRFTGDIKEKESAYLPIDTKNPHTFREYAESAFESNPVLTENSNATYDFLGWFYNPNGDGNQIALDQKITETKSFRVYALYKKPYQVEQVGSNFTISGTLTYIRKDTVVFKASVNKGYQMNFEKVTLAWDGIIKTKNVDYTCKYVTGGGVEYTINDAPSSNIIITGDAVANAYWVTGVKDTERVESIIINGSSEESVKVKYQSKVTVKIKPVLGYKVTKVQVLNRRTSAVLKEFNVDEFEFDMDWDNDVCIEAQTTEASFEVSNLTTDPYIHISVEGGGTQTFKDTVKLNVTIDQHYDVDKVVIKYNGVEKQLDDSYEFVMPQYDVQIYGYSKLHNYQVEWKNYDGTLLATSETTIKVAPTYPGSADPTKPSDDQYDYTFSGWLKDGETGTPTKTPGLIDSDTTFIAQYNSTVRKYHVVFEKYDHEPIKDVELDYGSKVNSVKPTDATELKAYIPEDTAQHSYTFKGWDKTIDDSTTVTGNMSYTAQYSTAVKSYDVKFYDSNYETILQNTPLTYGSIPDYKGAAPKKIDLHPEQYVWKFIGWSKTQGSTVPISKFDPITEETCFYPVFQQETRKYSIKFYSEDGTTLLQETQEEYGKDPVFYGDTPTKESTAAKTFTFDGWSLKTGSSEDPIIIKPVEGDASYYAHFSSTPIQYRIAFNENGGTVKENDKDITYKMVDAGAYLAGAIGGVSATNTYGEFLGWSDGYHEGVLDLTTTQMPAQNITLTAKWKTYNITVEDTEGGTVGTKSFSDVLVVHTDDLNISVNSGYVLDHFEYSYNNSNWIVLDGGMPFSPWKKGIYSSASNIKLRPVYEKVEDTVTLYLSANGLSFDTHGISVAGTVQVKKGLTFAQIKSQYTIPAYVYNGQIPVSIYGWLKSDYYTLIPDSEVINGDIFLAAAYVASQTS